MSIASSAIKVNTDAAVSAAFMEAGRIANNQFTKLAAKQLPALIRGYAETPFGKLIIANLAQVAISKFRADDSKASILAKAMLVQAYQEVYQAVDVEAMIDELLGNASIKRAMKTLDADKEE